MTKAGRKRERGNKWKGPASEDLLMKQAVYKQAVVSCRKSKGRARV